MALVPPRMRRHLQPGGGQLRYWVAGRMCLIPGAHTGLYRQIRERGAIVSEFVWGSQPNRQTFPQRNRIISGLGLGVIVIKAPQKSRSLITVTHAVDQDSEVFAVPGDVRSGARAGCHRLIKDGLKLVEEVDDVLEKLAG